MKSDIELCIFGNVENKQTIRSSFEDKTTNITYSASCSWKGKLDADKNRSWTEKDLKATVKVKLFNSVNNHRTKRASEKETNEYLNLSR